jgi:HEAT repeat protein
MQWWTSQQLRSKNPATRQQAVHKLAAEGSAQSVAALIMAVEDSYIDVRKGAIRALGRLREPRGLPALVQALRDPEADVREAAVTALREIGDLQAVDAMIAALQDPHGGVRWHAAKTLERFGWQPRTEEERLLRDVALGHFAAAAQAGLPALDHLTKALQDERSENRRGAVEALGQIDDPLAVTPLLSALADRDSSVRVAAIESLGTLRDAKATQALALSLRDPEPSVRAAAAATLGLIGNPESVSPLVKAVSDGHWNVRKAAVESLARLKDAAGVEALCGALRDPDHDVRESACRALAQLRDHRAIEALVGTLTDTQTSVRQAAASALRVTNEEWEKSEGARKAVPRLQAALKDREYWVRHCAADTLNRIETTSAQPVAADGVVDERSNAAFRALVMALGATHRDVLQGAIEALGRLGDNRGGSSILPFLQNEDKWLRKATAQSLTRLGFQPVGQDGAWVPTASSERADAWQAG